MNLTAGITLQGGKYSLERILGQSGTGITCKGTLTHLNHPVVIKTLKPNPQVLSSFAHLKQQLAATVQRLAQCQHPGLVRVLDYFEESGLPFVVMDFVSGHNLAAIVQTQGPLPERVAIHYCRQVSSALNALHQQGLVHRNLKPEHLICPAGSEVVILVNPEVLPQAPFPYPSDSSPVKSYAAIEQYQTQTPLTPATDIYALAASLYFILTGQKPTPAPLRIRDTASSKKHFPLTPPRQLQPQLSTASETAILSGLEIAPQNRPQTIAAWVSLLPDHTSVQNGTQAKLSTSSNGKRPSSATAHVSSTQVPTSVLKHPSPLLEPQQAKVLVTGIVIAASLGLGLGLALRFSASTKPGSSLFHLEQSFPKLKDWPGETEATEIPATAPSALPQPPALPQSEVPEWTLPVPRQAREAEPTPVQPSPQPKPVPEPAIEASPNPLPTPAPSSDPSIPPAAEEAPSSNLEPPEMPAADPVAPSNPQSSQDPTESQPSPAKTPPLQ